jgi:hypothetical protein
MSFGAPPQSPPVVRLVGSTLLGTALVVAGLTMAYLTVATPMVSELVETRPGAATLALGVWSFALVAGGGLLVAGTSRLAAMLATLHRGRGVGGPAARALGPVSAHGELAVASNVIPGEGRPIPEVVVGPFGVAVVRAVPAPKRVRRGAAGWEVRGDHGWYAMEDPRETASRDADRVRRWLGMAELDFVVRVSAVVLADGSALERWPACAVITSQQLPAWLASLPRQRTLTAGRRGRLLAMANAPAGPVASRRREGW